MPRGIWKGAIVFGLVNIPVVVQSAREDKGLKFRMLDKVDNAPVGYKHINKASGKEIPYNRIVKGYEYEPNRFVILTDEDFEKANVRATRTIDIEDFIELNDVDPLMFEKPYYLVPDKAGEKGYVLLRRALEQTQKVAIAKIVLHRKQHLCAIMAKGDYLILEILRYANEVREVAEADLLDDKINKVKISPRELKMAEELVNGMTTEWEPDKYEDTYREDLMKRIQQKISKGEVDEGLETEDKAPAPTGNILDLTPLLRQSLQAAGGERKSSRPSKARKKTSKKSKKDSSGSGREQGA